MALLKPRYYLAFRNLPQAVKAETLLQKLSPYTSLKGFKISSSRTENGATAELWSEDKKEIIAAAQHFYKHEKWTWIEGRAPRVEMRMSSGAPDSTSSPRVPRHVLEGENLTPEFIGEGSNILMDAFVPGVVVRLPEFKQRNMGVEMDVRLRNQYQLYGNPAIIVHNHGNGLVNVVLCTDFAGQTPAETFDGKREIICQRLLKRLVEISTLKRHLANGVEGLDPKLLHFERGCMLLTNRTWAELTVYTIDIKALARLEPSITTDQGAVTYGYTKLADPQMLLGRIKLLGEDAEKLHRTELRGSDLTLLKYPEKLKLIKRVQRDAEEYQREKVMKTRSQDYQEWKAKNAGWRIYTEPEEIMRRTLRKRWHDSKSESRHKFRREFPGPATPMKAYKDDSLGAKLGKIKRPIDHIEMHSLYEQKRVNRVAQQKRVELYEGLGPGQRGLLTNIRFRKGMKNATPEVQQTLTKKLYPTLEYEEAGEVEDYDETEAGVVEKPSERQRNTRTAGQMEIHRAFLRRVDGGVLGPDITQFYNQSTHDDKEHINASEAADSSLRPLKIIREGAKPPLPKYDGPSPKGIKIIRKVSGNRSYQGTRPELQARTATG